MRDVRSSLVRHVSRRRHQRGVVTVEFALVFPVLAMMLFGMIDIGRFIATRTMMAQAAAAGARQACLGSSTGTPDVDQAVRAAATMLSGINVSAYACADGPCTWPHPAGDVIAVTVQYNFVSAFYKMFQKSMTNMSRVVC
jgi:Flp pilus assembly protein TadG